MKALPCLVSRHRWATLAGLLIGTWPGIGFMLIYINREEPTSSPVFGYLRWFDWPGRPAEVLLTLLRYDVPIGGAHITPEQIVARWLVFVLVNIVLWVLALTWAAELWSRLRGNRASPHDAGRA